MSVFVFLVDGELVEYTEYYSIPENFAFDHVIRFEPDIPPDPHTQEQHEEIELWDLRLQDLMRKERSKK